MPAIWKRIVELLRRHRLDRELDDEVAFHLARLEEEFRRRGMDASAAAAAARREFGGVAQAKEAYRSGRGLPWLESLAQDLRYALRALRLNPGFTAAAVLSLALGIGASTAVFSLFHALLLRMLPVRQPQELVSLYRTGGWGSGVTTYGLFREMRKRTDLFSGVIASSRAEKVPLLTGQSDRLQSAQREFATGSYFPVLGVTPALGRLFTEDDDRTPRAHPFVVLSYDYWRTRFAADPAIVGRRLVVDQDPVTVIGVAAQGFHGLAVDRPPDLWEPVTMTKGDLDQPGWNFLWIAARRRPGLSLARTQAAMDVVMRQYLLSAFGGHPNSAFRKTAMSQHVEVREGRLGISLLRDRFAKPLAILMAAVLVVLLAACVNVANLLLARGAARRRELAMRVSLGATRARLVRQALTESLLLAAAGSACGLALASWGERGLLGFLPADAGNPFAGTPAGGPDVPVLAFSLFATIASVLLFGVAPALRTTAVDPLAGLRAPAGSDRGGRPLFRRALVVMQVAFSVVLAVLAGLFGHSLGALHAVDPGFRNQDVVAFSLDLPDRWKPADRKLARQRLMSQIEAMPGVSAVGFAFPGPYLAGMAAATVRVPGSPVTAGEAAWVNYCQVGPGFFSLLGSTPIAGREYQRSDAPDAPSLVVNEAFLRKYLPNEQHPLQRLIEMPDQPPRHITGVVRDIRSNGIREPSDPVVYVPAPMDGPNGTILVRSTLPRDTLAQAIRREAAHLGPQAAASDPRTIRQQIDDSIFQERMLSSLSGCFGILTLLLAAVGLYGVVAYGTARRAGEIGIRLALGAPRGSVLWMVLRGALALVAAGLAIGLPAALAAARYVGSVLFGVKPADPLAFAGTAAVLLAIAVAAAFLPARRSAAMDPMRALRNE